MNSITFQSKTRPFSLESIWRGFSSRKNHYRDDREIPRFIILSPPLKPDRTHMKAFNEVCCLNESSILNPLYPYTIAYPYIMRLLCMRGMPFPILRILNTRTEILSPGPLPGLENLQVRCSNSDLRLVAKGMEMDIISEVLSGEEVLWKGITTYFNRSRFRDEKANSTGRKLKDLSSNAGEVDWYFEGRDRFRFARISGDTNGIHYVASYARLFGFKRDFAQPIRVLARCLDEIPGIDFSEGTHIHYQLKGPVYYDRNLKLKYEWQDRKCRFDLYCEGNDRPCICGEVGKEQV